MEIIPDLDEKVIYPKGGPRSWATIRTFDIQKYERRLRNKLPNEFKNVLRGYNHRNADIISWYHDQNDYRYF
jgi:hypothetical protein